jgi:hypothetical protein
MAQSLGWECALDVARNKKHGAGCGTGRMPNRPIEIDKMADCVAYSDGARSN